MRPVPWVCRQGVRALASSPARTQFFRKASTSTSPKGDTNKLPPALLLRARKIAAEYDAIQKSLEDDFDPTKAKRLGDVSAVATALHDFDSAQSSLVELEAMLTTTDTELHALAREEMAATTTTLAKATHSLSASLTPKHPFDALSCMIEVRPGPGGMECAHFADTLFKMYRAYCSRKGLQTRVVTYDTGDGQYGDQALSEGVLEVSNEGTYGTFKAESGMHRVQRVPTTDKQQRIHTSAVAVWVMPSFPDSTASPQDFDNPESDFYINTADVRVEKMRAGGAGGQHVNKTESAIRLTHNPTGITVSMQEHRSQHQNREDAWRLLRARVSQQKREQREEEAESLRNSVLSKDKITRADKIRTYNYPQDRCSDHRSGLDVHNLPNVLGGGDMLDKILESAKQWTVDRDIRLLLAEEEENAKGQKGGGKGGKKGKK